MIFIYSYDMFEYNFTVFDANLWQIFDQITLKILSIYFFKEKTIELFFIFGYVIFHLLGICLVLDSFL